MAILATEAVNSRKGNLLKAEVHPEFTNEVVTMNDATTTLQPGTVLGRVTATGKFKVCKVGASDGSQNAAAIYVGNLLGEYVSQVLPNNTDQKVLAIARLAKVGANALVWDATFTTQAQKDAAINQLAAIHVLVTTQI